MSKSEKRGIESAIREVKASNPDMELTTEVLKRELMITDGRRLRWFKPLIDELNGTGPKAPETKKPAPKRPQPKKPNATKPASKPPVPPASVPTPMVILSDSGVETEMRVLHHSVKRNEIIVEHA